MFSCTTLSELDAVVDCNMKNFKTGAKTFSLRHSFICPVIVLKLVVTVSLALVYFLGFYDRIIDLIFFGHLKKSVYDRKK